MKASHKRKTVLVGYQEVQLEPGDFVFGRRKAAAALNLSERSIRTCISALKKAGRVTTKTTSKYSIISIIKWADYQQDDCVSDQQNDQRVTSETTSKRPASDQQATTNKNVKNVKKDLLSKMVSTNGTCPYEKLVELYHKCLPNNPKVRALSKARKSNIKARWHAKYENHSGETSNTIEFWERLFNYIAESRFLTGQIDPHEGRTRFYADIDFIFKESSFNKIFEGKYHG
jgi:hypothetical protein